MRLFRSFLTRATLSVSLVAIGTGMTSAAPVHLDTNTGQHASKLVANDLTITPVSFPMAGHHALDFDPLGAIARQSTVLKTVARIEYWRSNGTVLRSAVLRAKDGKITSTLAGVRWRQNPMPELQHSENGDTPQVNEGFVQPVLRWDGDIRGIDNVPGLFNGFYTKPAVVRCANGEVFELIDASVAQSVLADVQQPKTVSLSVGATTVKIPSSRNGIFWHKSPISEMFVTGEPEFAHDGYEQAALAWGDLGPDTGNTPPGHSGYSYPIVDDNCDDDPLYFISEKDLPDYRQTFPLGEGRDGGKNFSPFGSPFSSVPLPSSALLMLSAFVALVAGRKFAKPKTAV